MGRAELFPGYAASLVKGLGLVRPRQALRARAYVLWGICSIGRMRQRKAIAARFGRFVREQRKALRLSQMHVARALRDDGARGEATNSYVAKLERGIVEPKLGTILRLAEVLELEPGEMLEWAVRGQQKTTPPEP